MKSFVLALTLLGLISFSAGTIYFSEKFDDTWESRWVQSKYKESEGTQGSWKWTAGKYYNDENEDKGIQTTPDARFYQISAAFPEFSNRGKDLIIQYSVKHEQRIDCGGGYLKILPPGLDQTQFQGESPYNIMFGPDICGSSTRKTHLIFNYKGKNHLIKKDIKCENDEYTHLYTLILHPDNTYEVRIDDKEVAKGSLEEDFDMLPPKEIKDPALSKPADWVDEKMIPDPEDHKPEDWDSIPEEIPDPDASKPDDWDDELDGEWEPPTIPNPEYKGEWRPRMIENPAYKGEWVHPMIPNPDYAHDDHLYCFDHNAFVGFELWQVKSGTIFDNILITDDQNEADKWAALTKETQVGEKRMHDEEDEKRRAQEEERRKKQEVDDDDDDDDDEDEDDDDDDEDEDEHDHATDDVKDEL